MIKCDSCGKQINKNEDYYELDGELLCYDCAIEAVHDSDDFKKYCQDNCIHDDFLYDCRKTNAPE